MSRVLMTLQRYLHPRGAVRFWHTPIAPVRYAYAELADYYIDLTAKLDYRGPYDDEGIPLLDYFGPIGRQYNPTAIAQWGLGGYQAWKRGGDTPGRRAFERAAGWLAAHLVVDGCGRGLWHYTFDFDAYGLTAPWVSGLAQAQGISLLLRAHRELHGQDDLDKVRRACAAMLAPVDEGGLLLEQDGMTVIEEVVADRPTVILDGFMFAIFGLMDYCHVCSEDAAARRKLDACLDTLARLLPRFDLGDWSRADLYSETPPMPASRFYHGLHVAQLEVLNDITDDALIAGYAARWKSQLASPTKRWRANLRKLWFKFRHY
jgi:hypothetical protein